MTQLSSITPKPDHVPPDRVFDFDFYHPETLDEDIHVAWKRLHSLAPDVFWTPRNGGHWIATRAADIRRLQLESNNFSHKGLIIPYDPNMLPHPPTTTDPPEHAQYRALILPAFTPRAIASLEGRARAIAIDTIERLHPRGECEFIDEFAKVLPITVFLEMVDLPFSDRDRLLPLAAAATRSQTTAGRHAASIAMAEYLTPFMRQRLETPGKDLISHVVNATLFGRPIAFEEALMALVNLLFGGLDTVASMLGFTARFLAQNPRHRQKLIEQPDLIKTAIEEIIRRHGLTNTARLVTGDVDIGGVTLKAGDQILVPNALYGLDDRKFDRPMEVDFSRPMPIPLGAFGAGAHTCPGAVLARREIKVFLEEWLPRIPDFSIRPGTRPVLSAGVVQGVHRLELVWSK